MLASTADFGYAGLAWFQTTLVEGMPEVTGFSVVVLISFATTIIAAKLTPPTDAGVLVEYYRRTRPFGLWGPVRALLREEDRRYVDSENRNDLISLPFIFLYQVTLFLIPMQLVIHAYVPALVSFSLFAVGVGGMYCFWYRNLRPDNDNFASYLGEQTPLLRR